MNILITGAKGFIGKNLCAQLNNIATNRARWYKVDPNITIMEYDIDSGFEQLEAYCKKADFVFNLAGTNRPKDVSEFMKGNFDFTFTLLNTLKKYGNKCPVMISSSSQAALDNPYGQSKKSWRRFDVSICRRDRCKSVNISFPESFW